MTARSRWTGRDIGEQDVGIRISSLKMNAVSGIRRAARYRAAADTVRFGGPERERDVVCGIREYERLVERTLAREHDRRNDRHNGDHDHKLHECESSTTFFKKVVLDEAANP